jgi:hypothetical protein
MQYISGPKWVNISMTHSVVSFENVLFDPQMVAARPSTKHEASFLPLDAPSCSWYHDEYI